MDPIKQLEARLKEMVASREAFAKHVDRDALKEYVGMLLSDTQGIAEALGEITTIPMGTAISKLLAENKTTPAIKAYRAYVGQLSRNGNKAAAQAEKNIPLSSLAEATKMNLLVLTELEGNIEKLFKHNTINIFNSRLSHVVVIGILAECKMVNKYARYMLSAVISSLTGQREIAKYRYAWITEYNAPTAAAVSRAMAKTGSYNFQAMIKDMQTKAVDVSLIDDLNKVTVGMVSPAKVSSTTKSLITHGIRKLGMFRWIGEIFIVRKQNKLDEARREREWMQAHVDILKMKLEDMDESSKEYQRMVKIIENYEEMITKADRASEKETQ